MTIASVAVDDPIEAATANQLIANVNGSPGRAIFTANGLWSVPDGVHKFKVTLCGGGAGGHPDTSGGGGEDSYIIPGDPGNDSQMISALYSGVDVGTSYTVTIGAGGATADASGGTTSLGSILSSTGATSSSKGTATVTGGTQSMYRDHFVLNSSGVPYGSGGAGGGGAGAQGIVIIEW